VKNFSYFVAYVRDLIRQNLRAIKNVIRVGMVKNESTVKMGQEVLLRGRSPDFGDGAMRRVHFDFNSGQINIGTATKSILDRL
jgi:hypothetical protein